MQRLSPGQRWVIGLGVFALVLLVVGLVAVGVGSANLHATCREDGFDTPCPGDASGIIWGGVLAVIGLLHLGLTGLAGALVWTSTPTIAPAPAKLSATGLPREVVRVFAVGDLRTRSTQNRVLGRTIRGAEDAVRGWRHEDGASRPAAADDLLGGAVLTLEDWQLTALDRFLGPGFRRVEVETVSGTTAWVFTPVV